MLLKKNSAILLVVLPFLFGCNSNKKPDNPVVTSHVRDVTYEEFGNVNFEITQLQFENAGFAYGDLIDITISDWKEVTDDGKKNYIYSPGDTVLFSKTPFVTNYNEVGYFAPCLCNYQNASDRFDISFGINPFKNHAHELKDHYTEFTFTLVERGGYQKTLDLVRCTTKASLEEVGYDKMKFANVRDPASIIGSIDTRMKKNRFIRGSSPFNPKKNDHNDGRHAVADALLGNYKVTKEVSLSIASETESSREIASLMGDLDDSECPNTKEIYGFVNKDEIGTNSFDNSSCERDKVRFLTVGLGSDYFEDTDTCIGKTLTKRIFHFLSNAQNDDVYYLHCDEGKDRTGFFSMVIEALCGVSYKDIVADFMLTFNNYFGFNKYSEEGRLKYNTIKRITVCRHVLSIFVDNPASLEWEKINAEDYLREHFNITEQNDQSGNLLSAAARGYINRLFADDEEGIKGDEVCDKIIHYFGTANN